MFKTILSILITLGYTSLSFAIETEVGSDRSKAKAKAQAIEWANAKCIVNDKELKIISVDYEDDTYGGWKAYVTYKCK